MSLVVSSDNSCTDPSQNRYRRFLFLELQDMFLIMTDLHTALWRYSDYGADAVPQLKLVTAAIIKHATDGK